MDFVLGMDAGTSSLKGLALGADGATVLGPARRDYPIAAREGGIAEQSADDWWRAFREACGELAGAAAERGGRIVGLALSSQGGPVVCCDRAGRALAPAISWLDVRAGDEARELARQVGEDAFERTTGWPLHPGSFPAKALWLRKNDSGLWGRTERLLSTADYLVGRMTGVFATDPSDAAMMSFFDVGAGDWNDGLLRAAGVSRELLSPVRASGTRIGELTAEAAKETGLPQGIAVVNGAHDQYAAATGCGALREGAAMLSCGTAWVLLLASERFRPMAGSAFHPGAHVRPGLFGYLHAISDAGTAWNWHVRLAAGSDRPDWAEIEKSVAALPPGAEGVSCLPHFGKRRGGRAFAAGGVLCGLGAHAGGPHVLRAVMEGVAFSVRWAVGQLPAAGLSASRLTAIGGAARSATWAQIISDATRLPIRLPRQTESACVGAGILAGCGAGTFRDLDRASASWSALGGASDAEPREAAAKLYDELHEKHGKLAEAMSSGCE